ncbi:MAG: thrombospondin type 3 repeat-containing protein, partial [Saprospiraceae bacterium]
MKAHAITSFVPSPLFFCYLLAGLTLPPQIFNPEVSVVNSDPTFVPSLSIKVGLPIFVDTDNDGIEDGLDNCPNNSNPGQENNDGDAEGDVCDPDDDNDGILDAADSCPFIKNSALPNVLNLDGNTNFITLPPAVYFNSDFTIEAWIYPRNKGDFARIIDFGNGAGA